MKKKYLITTIVILGFGLLFGALNYNKISEFITYRIKTAKYVQNAQGELKDVFFEKVNLGKDAEGVYSTLTIGPDNNLYAASIDGIINSYSIENDGNLKLNNSYEIFGKNKKLLIGLHFDPNANENNLIAWITYSDSPNVEKGPAWNGRLARIKLNPNSSLVLENKLILTNLPRSGSDHLTNSIDFGKDGLLYISQGSNTANGLANHSPQWLNRSESLLSGAILTFDKSKLPNKLPLDTKTIDGGGVYDPFTEDAPLTIYATGVRNAYDIVWHSNGKLFATLNGSSSGEITPTSNKNSPLYIKPNPNYNYTGPNNIPSINKVEPSQNDYLASIKKGKYYGHPNPLRAEYILNHGDSDVDNKEYNGIKPDPNFDEYVYDFGKHSSSNGIIEYKSTVFNGKLIGSLIITRLASYYNDIIILKPDSKGNIIDDYDGKDIGLSKMLYPLDLIANQNTGDIYVSEYGNQKITLFRPKLKKASNNNILSDHESDLNSEKSVVLNGEAIYQRNCKICHGPDGKGATGPNLTDNEWIYGNSQNEIIRTIKNGNKNGSMPAWGNTLNENEIKKVALFILKLK